MTGDRLCKRAKRDREHWFDWCHFVFLTLSKATGKDPGMLSFCTIDCKSCWPLLPGYFTLLCSAQHDMTTSAPGYCTLLCSAQRDGWLIVVLLQIFRIIFWLIHSFVFIFDFDTYAWMLGPFQKHFFLIYRKDYKVILKFNRVISSIDTTKNNLFFEVICSFYDIC